MSTQPIASYTFLPWARQGLGTYISEGDNDEAVKLRGSFDVSLQVTGEKIAGGQESPVTPPHKVQLYGPGDVIGIDSKAVIRTEPHNWITNFEPNYMPFIEFYDEDLPWRYTPAAPNGGQLRPWLTLVVLEEGVEFDEKQATTNQTLPSIRVTDPVASFPRADQLWAWAHVHVDGGMGVDLADPDALAQKLDEVVATNRDLAYSRLLCPRVLKPNTPYHGFVIPSFETGRLAALGADPSKAPFATFSSWGSKQGYAPEVPAQFFPYYYRWFFRTGTVGDFEYLVRLLQPRTMDPRVGRRDFDTLSPDANLPPIDEFGGILRLGGALRAPLKTLSEDDLEEYQRFESWGDPYPHPFQVALASLVNLADDYKETDSALDANNDSGIASLEDDEDPWIVPPLYGRWHSKTSKLDPDQADPEKRHWVHELNLDPRHRIAAGFGTEIIQKNQENYMEAAWKQVGEVLKANERIGFGQMAKLVSAVWHDRELVAVQKKAPERFITMAGPVSRRVMANGLTVHHQVRQSTLPSPMLSTTMRKALRPRGRIAKIGGFNEERNLGNLLDRINAGEVMPTPPKEVPAILPTGDKVADQIGPRALPPGWVEPLGKNRWLAWLPILLGLLIVLLSFVFAPARVVVVGSALLAVAAAITAWLRTQTNRAVAVDVLRPDTRTPESVLEMPTSPDFRVRMPPHGATLSIGGTDSADARRFKNALVNIYTLDQKVREMPRLERAPLDLEALATATLEGLQPRVTIPNRVFLDLNIPLRIRSELVDQFDQIMAYPVIDIPMYEPLKNASDELFVPNLQLIGNNTISLLETNQKFIEAYMVGLNHEFSRELLWREYPTDQRGTSFRQFWDVSSFLPDIPTDDKVLRDKLRDIPELHKWKTNQGLGEHDNREVDGESEEELVLVIRGELLKKYPNAVIYAQKAVWEEYEDHTIDESKTRKLVELTEAEVAHPDRKFLKTPLYEAKIGPDIYFIGFDLTADEAKGGQIVNGKKDPGWFFVIKERPGEPRFGLDIPNAAPPAAFHTWNDLAWSDVMDAPDPHRFVEVGAKTVAITQAAAGDIAFEQSVEDSKFKWQSATSSAELAYILFQVPVMMAVHAAEMLRGVR